MGNTQGGCFDICGSKRHLDSVETNGSGNPTRPLRNVTGEREADSEETVNVLGSKSAHSSPNLGNGAHSSSLHQIPISPDQLAIDLSQVSSDDFDPNDSREHASSHRSIERDSEEPMLTSSIKPFNGNAGGKRSGSASSHSSVRGQSPTELIEREEAQREKRQQPSNKPPSLNLRQPNNQRSELDYESSSGANMKQYLSSADLENSKDDIELSTNNLTDFQDTEDLPSPLRETDDDFDSFYEKKRPEGADGEERMKFFSQKSASARSVKSEDSEHESSKLNHFKKLGRATLVTDGTSSLLSGRGGRGSGHKNRKSAVTLSAKPDSQRDSYGSSKLTKEELQLLAEAAKKQPNSSSTVSSTNSSASNMTPSDTPSSQNNNHSKVLSSNQQPSQPSISPTNSNLPTIFE
eukprot:gene11239-12245_t